MQRFAFHLLILVIGGLCLAVTWHLEPPIQDQWVAPKIRKPQPINRNYHLRLFAHEELNLQKLQVTLRWNEELVDHLQVQHGKLTNKARPQVKYVGKQATLTFSGRPGKNVLITGRGPLARLALHKKNKGKINLEDAIQVLSVTGIDAEGNTVTVKGIQILPFTPHRRPNKPAGNPGSQNE